MGGRISGLIFKHTRLDVRFARLDRLKTYKIKY